MGVLGTFLAQVIINHFTVICNAIAYIIIVAVSCMPKPGVKWTKDVIYAWMYDTLQTALPINRFIHGNPQTTTVLTVPQPQVSAHEVEAPIHDKKALSDTIAQFSKK